MRASHYIIIYKFTWGVIELLLGLGILFFGRSALFVYTRFASRELLEDPHDLLISFTRSLAPYVLYHRVYLIAYLTLFGLIKIIGAVGLVYDQMWGVDLLLVLTILLLPFQLYNLIFHHSLPDLIYVIIGLLIAMYLVNFHPRYYVSQLKRRYSRKGIK